MAILMFDGAEIRLKLSRWERLGALVSPPVARIDQVESIEFIDTLWSKDVLRGVRSPGTAIPYVVLIGVMRGSGFKDFCVIKRKKPGVIISFSSGNFQRWIYTLEGSRHAEEQILAGLGPISQ